MNNERYNQIIGDAYKSYQKEINRRLENWIDIQEGDIYEGTSLDDSGRIWTQEEFINKCKIDSEFSEKWGLKIEERELHSEERKTLYREHCMKNFWALKLHGTTLHYEHCMKDFWDLKITEMSEVDYENANIPTRLITTKYQNETIESYE